jgi:hypothetical protein
MKEGDYLSFYYRNETGQRVQIGQKVVFEEITNKGKGRDIIVREFYIRAIYDDIQNSNGEVLRIGKLVKQGRI